MTESESAAGTHEGDSPGEGDVERGEASELERIQARMDEIREEAAEDVDEKWTSTWRTPEVFDLKVKTRLSSHEEFQSLLRQKRELQEEGDAAAAGDEDEAGDEGEGAPDEATAEGS